MKKKEQHAGRNKSVEQKKSKKHHSAAGDKLSHGKKGRRVLLSKRNQPVEHSEALAIFNAGKPHIVWTTDQFAREFAKANRIGPQKMSNINLVGFCYGVKAYYGGRLLMDARPFFKELWHRISTHKIDITKAEACKQIGCTRQWVNMVVSGRAEARRVQRKNLKETRNRDNNNQGANGNLVSANESWTDEEYIETCDRFVRSTLQPVEESDSARLERLGRAIITKIEEFLAESKAVDEPGSTTETTS